MSNAATARTILPIRFSHCDAKGVIPVTVTIDTAGADLTIYSGVSGQHIGIVGIQYKESAAHNLQIKSGSNVLHTYEMGPYDGLGFPMSQKGLIDVCNAGESLVIQTDVVISTMQIYLAVFSQWIF